MPFFQTLTGYVAPLFLVASPVISYTDQAISMHRKRTSAGFSLDIPLIMLVASFLRYARNATRCALRPPSAC
jgi:solute carrier family 66, member 2